MATDPSSTQLAAPVFPPPSGQLDSLIQQTRDQQIQLSAMADNKAGMLLAAAALVIPLTVQHLADPSLRWPAVVIIATCIVTIALATFSVMPRPTPGSTGNPGDPGNNLLFFGSFSRMPYRDFLHALSELMRDPSRVYELELREIYLHGLHLARHKYRFLKYAYYAFIGGVVVSSLAWGITHLLSTY
jgi:hypothetical protein